MYVRRLQTGLRGIKYFSAPLLGATVLSDGYGGRSLRWSKALFPWPI